MKCILYSNVCRARITLMNGELITPVPDHPTHDVQHSKIYVHVSKQSLKKNAAQTDHPSKRLVVQAVSGMKDGTRVTADCTQPPNYFSNPLRVKSYPFLPTTPIPPLVRPCLFETPVILLNYAVPFSSVRRPTPLIRSYPIPVGSERCNRHPSAAEGWHHGFNAMMSCSNPSIWKFLQCLKNEQNITDVKMTKLMMRESPEPRSAKWRKYDEKLQAIIQKFDSYPTILDFLKCTNCIM